MAHRAAEAYERVISLLEQHAAAIRTGEARAGRPLESGRRLRVRHWHGSALLSIVGGLERLLQPAAHRRRGQDGVRVDVLQRAAGHGVEERVARVLHYDAAAFGLDRHHARGAVVPGTAQDDAGDGGPVGGRGGAHRLVDRGAVAVLLRPPRERQQVVLDDHVVVAGRHVDRAGVYREAVGGRVDRYRTGAREDLRKHARASGREVQDHEDGRGELLGKPGHERGECLDAAGRRPKDDDVLCIAGPGPDPICGHMDRLCPGGWRVHRLVRSVSAVVRDVAHDVEQAVQLRQLEKPADGAVGDHHDHHGAGRLDALVRAQEKGQGGRAGEGHARQVEFDGLDAVELEIAQRLLQTPGDGEVDFALDRDHRERAVAAHGP